MWMKTGMCTSGLLASGEGVDDQGLIAVRSEQRILRKEVVSLAISHLVDICEKKSNGSTSGKRMVSASIERAHIEAKN